MSTEDVPVDAPEDSPPRDSLVRISTPFTLTRSSDGGMPTLHGVGAVYDEWTEINSRFEGHFMERFAPGSFRKTVSEGRDRIRCLFHHGQDPNIGVKPLGTITDLSERGRGVEYSVDLFDADYVRSLVPGLEGGVYGSSFRFGIVKKEDERKRVSNDKGLLERTIREASMRELGPTPFPAYADAAVLGIRSDSLMAAMMQDPETAMRMLAMFRDGTPLEPPPESGTPHDEEPPPRSRPVHSGRSVREQIQANTALLLQGQYRR